MQWPPRLTYSSGFLRGLYHSDHIVLYHSTWVFIPTFRALPNLTTVINTKHYLFFHSLFRTLLLRIILNRESDDILERAWILIPPQFDFHLSWTNPMLILANFFYMALTRNTHQCNILRVHFRWALLKSFIYDPRLMGIILSRSQPKTMKLSKSFSSHSLVLKRKTVFNITIKKLCVTTNLLMVVASAGGQDIAHSRAILPAMR